MDFETATWQVFRTMNVFLVDLGRMEVTVVVDTTKCDVWHQPLGRQTEPLGFSAAELRW